jgi:mRNA interferase HigB
MRIYSHKTLKEFWDQYPDARTSLEMWYEKMEENTYETPNQVIKDFKDADIIGNGRVVFNIALNKYRLVAYFRYKFHAVYVRFIGTHKEYDKIKDISNL